jgi:hypothetical protein
MKRPALITIGIAAALLVGICLVLFIPAGEPVSLTLSDYHYGPHGATLKLINNSRKMITYLTDPGDYMDMPVLSSVLLLQKTGRGWTNTSPPVMSEVSVESFSVQPSGIVVGHTNQFYSIGLPGNSPNAGFMGLLRAHELKPGRSTELYVSLEPDGPPIRVGTVCIIPQSKLAQQFDQWMVHIKRWCHLKANPPGQVEVWCNESLQVPSKPTHEEKR